MTLSSNRQRKSGGEDLPDIELARKPRLSLLDVLQVTGLDADDCDPWEIDDQGIRFKAPDQRSRRPLAVSEKLPLMEAAQDLRLEFPYSPHELVELYNKAGGDLPLSEDFIHEVAEHKPRFSDELQRKAEQIAADFKKRNKRSPTKLDVANQIHREQGGKHQPTTIARRIVNTWKK